MPPPTRGLWTDPDALRRLARLERNLGDRRPEAPFDPPIECREEFRLFRVETSVTLVGGDYADAFLIDPSRLALVMADVSGKGVGAAVLRGVLRSLVRNLAPICHSPAELLNRLDRILHQAELGPMYATLFVAFYETESGSLTWANAGHPIPLRVDRAGRVWPFGGTTGPILGILGSASHAPQESRLERGERLVLFTDGISEAAGPNDEFFGTDRLTLLLADQARVPLGALGSSIVEQVRRHRGPVPQDDSSLMLFERR